jgi:hypothetical protein
VSGSNAASWPDELLAAIRLALGQEGPATITVPRPTLVSLAQAALGRMAPGRTDIEVKYETDAAITVTTTAGVAEPSQQQTAQARASILAALAHKEGQA